MVKTGQGVVVYKCKVYSDFFPHVKIYFGVVTLFRVKGRVCKLFAQVINFRYARREPPPAGAARGGIFRSGFFVTA